MPIPAIQEIPIIIPGINKGANEIKKNIFFKKKFFLTKIKEVGIANKKVPTTATKPTIKLAARDSWKTLSLNNSKYQCNENSSIGKDANLAELKERIIITNKGV